MELFSRGIASASLGSPEPSPFRSQGSVCSSVQRVAGRLSTPGGLACPICVWRGQSRADGTPAPSPQSQPLFELRCSNNVVHMHTCADSCALLVNLLQYVTSAGDLHPPPRPPSPTEIAGQKVQVRPGPTGHQSSAWLLPCHSPPGA